MERILPIAVLLLSTRLWADSSQLPPPDQDPFVGEWMQVNGKSLPHITGRYSRTISREAEYVVFSSYDSKQRPPDKTYRIKCDGQLYPVPGNTMLSCEYSSSRSVIGTTRQPGGTVLYWSREVSPDGNEMRIFGFKDQQRKNLQSIEILDRVK